MNNFSCILHILQKIIMWDTFCPKILNLFGLQWGCLTEEHMISQNSRVFYRNDTTQIVLKFVRKIWTFFSIFRIFSDFLQNA